MCSQVFGFSVVLSRLGTVFSFAPCAAGCWAKLTSLRSETPPAVRRLWMNDRRFRYTCRDVISELAIFGIGAYLTALDATAVPLSGRKFKLWVCGVQYPAADDTRRRDRSADGG